MIFVSPQPSTWYKISIDLKAKWAQHNMTCSPPPVALVLSGWTMSNDFDKQERWLQTLKWVDNCNLQHLIPELKNEEKYFVEELSSWRPFEAHDFVIHPKRYKPTKDEKQNAILKIQANWKIYLGKEFAEKTKPIKLTGNKARRLLVQVDANYQPPWGTWTQISIDKKTLFANFRQKINNDISPIAVDHIDFL
ncbi:MAG: hypothetical protein ABJB05_13690 [Parafilimonas sp.]